MIDPTRREFLATAGTTIASAKRAGAGTREHDTAEQARNEPAPDSIPPQREQKV